MTDGGWAANGDAHGARVGVVLMTFGTAESVDDVPAYLARVRGGAPVSQDLATEFQRRFALIGGSPLTRITRQQASALEETLNRGSGGARFAVAVGMRFSTPSIPQALDALDRGGARRILAIVLSPQFSPVVLGGYLRDARAAHETLAIGAELRIAGPWHDVPLFVEALATRLTQAMSRVADGGDPPYVLFTAHSIPCRVAEQDPAYLDQLRSTATAVAQRAGLPGHRWRFVYQSAGHTGDEWLTPDVRDVLPELIAKGCRQVLIAPVQFLADHLEVLYDIDVAAREEAATLGITLQRVESLNTMPVFVEALAEVVHRELAQWNV
jgi:ferrochelatase